MVTGCTLVPPVLLSSGLCLWASGFTLLLLALYKPLATGQPRDPAPLAREPVSEADKHAGKDEQ